MLVERELPAKIGRCSKKPPGRILTLEQNPPERIFFVHSNSSSSDPSSTGAFFIYLEYLDAKKMMKYLDMEKMRDKVLKSLMS